MKNKRKRTMKALTMFENTGVIEFVRTGIVWLIISFVSMFSSKGRNSSIFCLTSFSFCICDGRSETCSISPFTINIVGIITRIKEIIMISVAENCFENCFFLRYFSRGRNMYASIPAPKKALRNGMLE